jgi:hypothetical protein
MSDSAKEREAEPHQVDEGATAQIVACLAETARQLREMAEYLQELARMPLEDSRTLH